MTFETSTTYSLVLGVKLDLRPGEILALRWERMHPTISSLMPQSRSAHRRIPSLELPRRGVRGAYPPHRFCGGPSPTQGRERDIRGYNVGTNLVVTDRTGNVPDIGYIRKALRILARNVGIHYIPPTKTLGTQKDLCNRLHNNCQLDWSCSTDFGQMTG